MSSPLDERMRRIAREEATGSADFATNAEATQQRLSAMEEEVAELRAKLEKLEGGASTPTTKRATRTKTAETTE